MSLPERLLRALYDALPRRVKIAALFTFGLCIGTMLVACALMLSTLYVVLT